MPLEIPLSQSAIEIRGASGKLAHAQAVRPVFLIQLAGLLCVRRVDFTAFFKKLIQPVVLPAVSIDGILHDLRVLELIVLGDDALGPFNDPRQHGRTCILIQEVAVVLLITFSGEHRIERNDDQSAPGTLIGCADAGQVVCVQDQGV